MGPGAARAGGIPLGVEPSVVDTEDLGIFGCAVSSGMHTEGRQERVELVVVLLVSAVQCVSAASVESGFITGWLLITSGRPAACEELVASRCGGRFCVGCGVGR